MRETEYKTGEEDLLEFIVQLATDDEELAHVLGAIEGRLVFIRVVEGSRPEDGDGIGEAVGSAWDVEGEMKDLDADFGGDGEECGWFRGHCSGLDKSYLIDLDG
jgi:hypothetical protein